MKRSHEVEERVLADLASMDIKLNGQQRAELAFLLDAGCTWEDYDDAASALVRIPEVDDMPDNTCWAFLRTRLVRRGAARAAVVRELEAIKP